MLLPIWKNQMLSVDDRLEAAIGEIERLYAAMDEIEKLRACCDRYETSRILTPREWQEAWQLNISTGKPFDEIIDELKPFVRPDA